MHALTTAYATTLGVLLAIVTIAAVLGLAWLAYDGARLKLATRRAWRRHRASGRH